jgi:hypothetical protein
VPGPGRIAAMRRDLLALFVIAYICVVPGKKKLIALRYHGLSGMLVLAAICAQAQSGMNVRDHLLIERTRKALSGTPEENYEGSPYMNDNYTEAQVYSKDKTFVPVLMRYDIFHNLMEFKDRNETLLLDPDPRITRIDLGNQTFVVEHFKFNGKSQNYFMELVKQGTLTLLAKSNVNYREKVEFGSVPAKYSRSADEYYCKLDNQAIFKVSSVKKLIGSLPDKREELSRFAAEQHLSFSRKDDLLKFVNYYNSLHSVQ